MTSSTGAAVRLHRNAVRHRPDSLSAFKWKACPPSPESADNFWIELDRLLGAPTTAAQMEALMESYGPVWPDIHDRAINSPDHFRSLTRALVISGMTPQEAQAKIGSREE